MTKYPITKKTIVGKLFISIPLAFFTSFTYLANIHPIDEEGKLHLKGAMFVDFWFWLIVVATFLLTGILIYIIIRKHKFYDDGEFFVVEKGLFWKREVKLSYKQINTVSIKRSLIDLILKTAKVEIDSGAALNVLPEVKLPLNLEYAYYLKKYLETKKHDSEILLEGPNEYYGFKEEDENIIYQAKKRSLLLMGIIRQGSLIAAFIFSVIFSSILSAAEINGVNNPDPVDPIGSFKIILLVSLMSLGLLLILGLVNIITHYNYKLNLNENSLEYEYGLISKSSFKFEINKINAIYVTRSLLYRLFNKYSLELSVIGIGEDVGNTKNAKRESKYILPISTKEELEKVLKIIDASELLERDLKKPSKYAITNLIVLPLIIPTIITVAIIIWLSMRENNFYLIISNILVSYIMIVIYYLLRYKYHGYKLEEKLLIKSGSFTTKKGLIKKESIQLISYNNGPIKRLLGIGNVDVNYRSPLEKVVVKGLVFEDFYKINEKVFSNSSNN